MGEAAHLLEERIDGSVPLQGMPAAPKQVSTCDLKHPQCG